MVSMSRRRPDKPARQPLPPIVNEDDGDLPFMKQDFFSDVSINVGSKKLWSSRCILAYNSPVFEKSLANAKKHEIDMSSKSYDDIVELLCYLDPRVPYSVTAQSAKQLLPLAEEYQMFKLRRACENALHTAFEALRREYNLGQIPVEVNEEYLLVADRYGFEALLRMCVKEYVYSPPDTTKSVVNSDTVSEGVKLMVLEQKLARLNVALEKERRYKQSAEYQLDKMSPRKKWTNKFGLY